MSRLDQGWWTLGAAEPEAFTSSADVIGYVEAKLGAPWISGDHLSSPVSALTPFCRVSGTLETLSRGGEAGSVGQLEGPFD